MLLMIKRLIFIQIKTLCVRFNHWTGLALNDSTPFVDGLWFDYGYFQWRYI